MIGVGVIFFVYVIIQCCMLDFMWQTEVVIKDHSFWCGVGRGDIGARSGIERSTKA